MPLRPFITPLLVLIVSAGAVAWLMIAEPPAVPPGPGTDHTTATTTSETALRLSSAAPVAPLEAAPAPMSAAPLPSQIRNVAPDGVTAPDVTGALTRVEPAQVYLDLKNPPVEPIPDGPLEIRRPEVVNAGILKSGRLIIRLAHIKPLTAAQTCVSRLGGSWPCGARARTSLRGLIRMFAIDCEKTEELGPQEISAVCTRRNIDLGEWLVKYGWAEPLDSAPDSYHAVAVQAKDKKIGQWQSEWLDTLRDSVASTELPATVELSPDVADFLNETGAGLIDGDPLNPFDIPLDDLTRSTDGPLPGLGAPIQ